MRIVISVRYGAILKILLAASLVLVLIGAACFLYFYHVYARRIDKALLEQPWEHYPIIYGAPTILFPRQELDPEILCRMLEQRGYTQSRLLRNPPAYYRLPESATVLIANGDFRITSGPRFPAVAQITFTGNVVDTIQSLDRTPPSLEPFFLIRPPLLSAQTAGTRRMHITFNGIPQNLVYAILAAEDRHFFEHPGVDIWGILRSLWKNIQQERVVAGGSTITQQLVKNIFLSPRRTLTRKLQEAFIAFILESRLTKKQLFEIYVNQVYMGQATAMGIYGFAQAAEVYCGKSIRNLSTGECALLAGMVHSPNMCHPFRYPAQAIERREQVLAAMTAAGFILPEEAQKAKAEPVAGPDPQFLQGLEAPYFLDYLGTQVENASTERSGGKPAAIQATLSLELQGAAETGTIEGLAIVKEKLRKDFPDEPVDQLQVALVVLRPQTGEVLAMVGGTDYHCFPFNRAANSSRQAGSVLKPFVYACLLDAGNQNHDLDLTASSIVNDQPVVIPFDRRVYHPHNYKDIYLGPVTMKTALAHSLNSATLQYARRLGFPEVAAMVNRLEFAQRAVPFPSTALGTVDVSPLEVARAYTAFYNGGVIKDGCIGQPARTSPVFSREAGFIVLDILRETVKSGTAKNVLAQGIDMPMAAKTGTAHDGWFVGLLGNLICCCWIGYDDNREFPLAGGQSALYVFTSFIHHAQKVYPVSPLSFNPPSGVATRTVCRKTGLLASSECQDTETDYFFIDTIPQHYCHGHH